MYTKKPLTSKEEKNHDNHINCYFSDKIMSDITTKELLGKWCELTFNHICCFLYKYHFQNEQVPRDIICRELQGSYYSMIDEVRYVTCFLEDLVNESLYGLEDIFTAVYGILSDEVFVVREFNRMVEKGHLDEGYIWDFTDRPTSLNREQRRLAKILSGEVKGLR